MSSSKPWPLESERAILADACVPGRHPHSLWNFIRYAAGWHYRIMDHDGPYWMVPHLHKPMVSWLQQHLEEWWRAREKGLIQRKYILIVIPREHGKSNTVTRNILAYCMLKDPDLTSQMGSETLQMSQMFFKGYQSILDGSDPHARFTEFYGNWYDPERTWKSTELVTAARRSLAVDEPSIGTFSPEKGITGKHPLIVIYDDPVTQEKLKDGGGKWLEVVQNSMKAIDPALRNDGLFLLIGTRYLEDDPIGACIRLDGVKSWTGHEPVDQFQEGSWDVYFLQARDKSNLTSYPKGEPILSESGFTDLELSRREERDPIFYAAVMMNDPTTGEHMELTRTQIGRMIVDREWVKENVQVEYATIHLDTAFKSGDRRKKGDYNAIVTWLHDLAPTGVVYLDSVLRSKAWRSEEFHTALIQVMRDLRNRGIRIRALTDEREVGGKSGIYLQHLTNVIAEAGLRPPEIIQLNRGSTKKTDRIRTAAGYWVEGYVRLIQNAKNLDRLIDEMVKIGITPYDDVSDAAADVFLPEIWRRPQHSVFDDQPAFPRQPGDDVLKGPQITRDYKRLVDDMNRSPFADDNEGLEFQPYENQFKQSQERED